RGVVSREDPGGAGRGDTAGRQRIFQTDGNAGELADLLAAGTASIDLARLRQRELGRSREEGAKTRVLGLDRGNAGPRHFFRGDLAPCDCLGDLVNGT